MSKIIPTQQHPFWLSPCNMTDAKNYKTFAIEGSLGELRSSKKSRAERENGEVDDDNNEQRTQQSSPAA